MCEIDAKMYLRENSKNTYGNILFQKEIENYLYLPAKYIKKYINKVGDAVNRLQMKSIKF